MEEDEDFFTEAEIQEIPEDDEEFGYVHTEKHHGALSSKQLLERIENDPNHIRLVNQKQTGGGLVIVSCFTVFMTVLILVTDLVALQGADLVTTNLLGYGVILGMFWSIFLCMYFSNKRWYGLWINELGIINKATYGFEAIEWRHIAWMTIRLKGPEENIVRLEIAGNRRKILYFYEWLSDKITMNDIRKYIPDIDQWEKSRNEEWIEGIYKYTRPTVSAE